MPFCGNVGLKVTDLFNVMLIGRQLNKSVPFNSRVTLSARGSGGFALDVSIPNVSGVK